jgi:methionyl-tRNA formyltransferase
MGILFFGKKGDTNTEVAAKYTKQIFPDAIIYLGSRGDNFPTEETASWSGDYILSYLSPWIIPKSLLDKATKGAINWHPGSPEYPGIGCTNFAIYNGAKEFGSTCHFMNPKVDTGQIIEVARFSILKDDTVFSITQKCYAHILSSYYSIIEKIANDEEIVACDEKWQRVPYTRKELDALCVITQDMDSAEIDRRVKATTYDRPWAYTIINERKFFWKE